MRRPLYLKGGDTVGIVSPSGFISSEVVSKAGQVLKSKGFNVIIGDSSGKKNGVFAGTDNERARDMQMMIDNPEVKAVFCSRGGYGAIRTLRKLNFSSLINKQKWIIGFSDITVFHSLMNNLDIESIHGAMLKDLIKRPIPLHTEKIFDLLKGEPLEYEIPYNKHNITGQSEGMIAGGNLSVLYSLRGTSFDLQTDGKILFIEDLDEYYYHLDRIFMNFVTGGFLNGVKGLIVGSFSNLKDGNVSFGKNHYEIISEHAEKLNIPVMFDFPSGHEDVNYPLLFGRKATLTVSHNKSQLSFDRIA